MNFGTVLTRVLKVNQHKGMALRCNGKSGIQHQYFHRYEDVGVHGSSSRGRYVYLRLERAASRKGVPANVNDRSFYRKIAVAYDLPMLPRTCGRLVLWTLLWVCPFALVCPAQHAQPAATVRYHFGDDPDGKLGWANPNFDDSDWPIARNGRWPMPPFYSEGTLWVRFRTPARSNVSGPLAVRSSPPFLVATNTNRQAMELYVGGMLVGRQGSLPPHVDLDLDHRDAVFDLPVAAAAPGTTAVVALRTWYPPSSRRPMALATWEISVDEIRILILTQRADRSARIYANGLDLELNVLFLLLGTGVLVAWRWAGARDLLVFAWLLILQSLNQLFVNPSLPGIGALSWRTDALINTALPMFTMLADIEFIYTVYGFRTIWMKRLWQSSALVFCLAYSTTFLATTSGPIVRLAMIAGPSARLIFAVIQLCVCLWVILVSRTNRLVAVAFVAIATAGVSAAFGILPFGVMVGPFYEHTLAITFFLCAIALLLMLSQRAWKAWRVRDELRVEFEAAREMQQQLVAPAVDVPGFRIESAYIPAKHVGGDFFRVLPWSDGSILVVVGDVSGKGLKAAMTVSAIMGALRDFPSGRPAEVLAHLNRVLYGQVSGFVTCCVARIRLDGATTISNAGHLSPYLAGAELPVAASLPLGILPEANYGEMQTQITLGDRLTFVSDGVVEATNSEGELYGFERTQANSSQTANTIAEAARLFGQEDDITVLALTRENVRSSTSTLPSVPALSD